MVPQFTTIVDIKHLNAPPRTERVGDAASFRVSRDDAATAVANQWRSGTWRKEQELDTKGGKPPFSFYLPPDNPTQAFSVLKQAVNACHSQ
jgi:hypothetical protein